MAHYILLRDTIVAAVSLHITWAVFGQTGVSDLQVQSYVKHMMEMLKNKIPEKKKLPGKTCEISHWALRLVQQSFNVEAHVILVSGSGEKFCGFSKKYFLFWYFAL